MVSFYLPTINSERPNNAEFPAIFCRIFRYYLKKNPGVFADFLLSSCNIFFIKKNNRTFQNFLRYSIKVYSSTFFEQFEDFEDICRRGEISSVNGISITFSSFHKIFCIMDCCIGFIFEKIIYPAF